MCVINVLPISLGKNHFTCVSQKTCGEINFPIFRPLQLRELRWDSQVNSQRRVKPKILWLLIGIRHRKKETCCSRSVSRPLWRVAPVRSPHEHLSQWPADSLPHICDQPGRQVQVQSRFLDKRWIHVCEREFRLHCDARRGFAAAEQKPPIWLPSRRALSCGCARASS